MQGLPMDTYIGTSLTPDQREVLSDFILASHNTESELHVLLDLLQSSSPEAAADQFASFSRALETLKGNLAFCGMVEISRFFNHFMRACQAMRDGVFRPDAEIREALLQAFDHAVQYARELSRNARDCVRVELLPVDPMMRRLASAASQAQARDVAAEVFSHVAGVFEIAPSLTRLPEPVRVEPVDIRAYLSAAESRSVAALVAAQEKRNPYWKDRIQVQLDVALAVNRVLAEPCDPKQLVYAVCLHDLGMMFLPDSILLKNSRLDPDETAQIRKHVEDSCSFLGLGGNFAPAARMIAEHHEHYDGSGYPVGLAGDALCPGGQLIGLVDAYFAMTHLRPDRAFRRSAFRALVEMNHAVGTQFSPEIVAAFNGIVRNELDAPLPGSASGNA